MNQQKLKVELYNAVNRDNLEVVKFLVENGATYGPDLLYVSFHRGDLEMVKFLVENSHDINEKDNSGDSPLHYACVGGKLEIVKILVKNGADINGNTRDRTPLIGARRHGYSEIVEYLKEQQQKKDKESFVKIPEQSTLEFVEKWCEEHNYTLTKSTI